MTPGPDDTISPLELAALAESMQDTQAARHRSVTEDGGPVVLRYDLIGAAASPRHSLPGLDLIHERYARFLGKELERDTRTASRVVAERPLVLKFAEIYAALKPPTCLIVVEIAGIGTTGLLVVDPRLFYFVHEVMLGGDGQSPDLLDESVALLDQRGFTPPEERTLKEIVEHVSNAQRFGWWDVVPGVRLKYVRAQVDPRHAAILNPGDLVLESPLSVELGGVSGTIRLLLPLTALRPLEKQLTKTVVDAGTELEDRWQERIADLLHQAPVEVVAELGRTTMTLRQLLELGVGDLVRLGNDPGSPIRLHVEGVTKYEALPSVHQGNYAVRLAGLVQRDAQRDAQRARRGGNGPQAEADEQR